MMTSWPLLPIGSAVCTTVNQLSTCPITPAPHSSQHWVAMQTNPEAAVAVVQALVAAGGDPNAKTNEGATPLVSFGCLLMTNAACW